MSSVPASTTPAPSSPPSHCPKPFCFKKKRSHSSTLSDSSRRRFRSRSREPAPRRHRRHHHHRSRWRHPHTPPEDPYVQYNHQSKDHLDPDTAFRESLFDALADDEGAAFWEGVYGQPIHTYSPYHRATSTANDPDDDEDPDNPRLERMSDEEYVSYVRGKMWEKSHQYIFEERKRREEERRRREEREREGRRWQDRMDEAIRRGEEKKRRGRWNGVWERYGRGWDNVFTDSGASGAVRERIPWPVASGKAEEVCKEEVERFFMHAPQAAAGGQGGVDLMEVLKKERVRWHPDKMMQRAGEGGLNAETLKEVTSVFQVVDGMLADMRKRAP